MAKELDAAGLTAGKTTYYFAIRQGGTYWNG